MAQRRSVLQNEKDTLTVSVNHMGAPIKVSFFGGVKSGCVCKPDKTDDDRVDVRLVRT